MRVIVAAFAALGGGLILAAFAVSVARGDGAEATWLLLGQKHVNAIFTKLGLSAEHLSHRRVTAVLTFLRVAGLRG
jgi:hypothetical protein